MKHLLLVGSFVMLLTHSARAAFLFADFTGNYDFQNWSQVHSYNDSGSVTHPDFRTVVLRGSDNGSGSYSSFDFVITFTESSQVRFYWNYSSVDGFAGADDAGWLLNGTFHRLAGNGDSTLSGWTQLTVNPGDTFGWRIRTTDNEEGYGSLEITAVPETSTVLAAGLLIAYASAASWKRWRTNAKQ